MITVSIILIGHLPLPQVHLFYFKWLIILYVYICEPNRVSCSKYFWAPASKYYVCELVMATVTKHHKLGGLKNNRTVLFLSPGGYTSKFWVCFLQRRGRESVPCSPRLLVVCWPPLLLRGVQTHHPYLGLQLQCLFLSKFPLFISRFGFRTNLMTPL